MAAASRTTPQPSPSEATPIDTLARLRDLYATDKIDELELETRTEAVLKREAGLT